MTEEEKRLSAENDRLKRRIKILEKRLAKFRKKDADAEEVIAELAEEAEIKTTLNRPIIKEDRCPKCGRELQDLPVGHGIMKSCTNTNCTYVAVEPFKLSKKS